MYLRLINTLIMNIVHWNISFNSKRELIAQKLIREIAGDDTVICLQEVTKATYNYFRELFETRFRFVYSLDHRAPGDYDSNVRKLGVLILVPNSMKILHCGVMRRTPYPDRTAFATISDANDRVFRILSLHSVAGCNFSRGKSVQFDSFAEAVKDYNPDILTTDANEPMTDHWDIRQMDFFNNRDKGNGARNFFTSIADNGMQDAYASVYDKDSYVPGKYLTTSHRVPIGKYRERRYDFIFVKSDLFKVDACSYSYEEALESSADHAILRAKLEWTTKTNGFIESTKRSTEEAIRERIKACRYWHGEDHCQDKFSQYERKWVYLIEEDPQYLEYLISGYIQSGLELFNLDDGVPMGLKAMLFNRYQHWSSGYEDSVGGFMSWYRSQYLKEES